MSNAFRSHIAVFGGSFDPPHIGHEIAVQGLLEHPGVGNVLVLPTYKNNLKLSGTSYQHRFEMAKLNFKKFEVSDFESSSKIKSSFELLSSIKRVTSEKPIGFVIGSDQLENLNRWVNFPQFLGLCDWIVLVRKPKAIHFCFDQIRKLLNLGILKSTENPDRFQVKIGDAPRFLTLVETSAPEISSTQIREKITLRKKNEIATFLKKDVLEYIERNSLYGT